MRISIFESDHGYVDMWKSEYTYRVFLDGSQVGLPVLTADEELGYIEVYDLPENPEEAILVNGELPTKILKGEVKIFKEKWID